MDKSHSKERNLIFLTENNKVNKKAFGLAALQQYQSIANKYKDYINALTPRIENICQKEDYRSYLKEQKLGCIKNQLINKKKQLQKQLEEKLDPTKSANGKLYTDIITLTSLESNYNNILINLQNSVSKKQEQIRKIQQLVQKQKYVIKQFLKCEFQRRRKEKETVILPSLFKNSSDLLSIGRSSHMSHSRMSILSRINISIQQKSNQRLSNEEDKLTILKLFVAFAKTQLKQNSHHFPEILVDQLEKDILIKQKYLEQIRKLMGKPCLSGQS